MRLLAKPTPVNALLVFRNAHQPTNPLYPYFFGTFVTVK